MSRPRAGLAEGWGRACASGCAQSVGTAPAAAPASAAVRLAAPACRFPSEVVTRLSPLCCEDMARSGAASTIFVLIRSCNRSVPCMEVISCAVQVLLNVAKVTARFVTSLGRQSGWANRVHASLGLRSHVKIRLCARVFVENGA